MNEAVPAQGLLSEPEREGQPSQHGTQRPVGTPHQVLVQFHRRMKRQRVYPLTVELHKQFPESPVANHSTAPVLVRPSIPGAQVTPAEQELKSVQTGERATFYVTPSACGWLFGARLQILQQGLLLQEIRLSMKTAGQLLTWLLAALVVLIPAAVLCFTKYVNLSSTGPYGGRPATANRRPRVALPADLGPAPPAPAPLEDRNDGLPPGVRPQGIPPGIGEEVLLAQAGQAAGAGGQARAEEQNQPKAEGDQPQERAQPKAGDQGKGQGEQPRVGDRDQPKAGEGAQPQPGADPPRGGGMMEAAIEAAEGGVRPLVLGPAPKGPLERVLLDSFPPFEFGQFGLTASAAADVQHAYDLIQSLASDHLGFYLGVVLLGLTAISWISHRPARARRRGPPVVLASGVGQALVVADWPPRV